MITFNLAGVQAVGQFATPERGVNAGREAPLNCVPWHPQRQGTNPDYHGVGPHQPEPGGRLPPHPVTFKPAGSKNFADHQSERFRT
jgi:hypothetical protein